jgi:hypothetical protein
VYKFYTIYLLLLVSPAGHSEEGVPDPNVPPLVQERPLFNSEQVLELSLSVDFDAMCRPNEVEDCEYAPATLMYETADGEERAIPVEIRVRGGWRARKNHCEVPPLFVRFAHEGIAATPFSGQELLPLTTHCKNLKSRARGAQPSRNYEQYVLKEYLGYRLYNMVTDRSLRVRLARITYQNPARPGDDRVRYAFFTEHFDDMAARLDTLRLREGSFDHESIDLRSFDEVALFNFMIGNTDFSVVRERNIVLIAATTGRQYPVPYDLDMSGLVDAEYAGVSPRLDFRDPRQRYYLGFCHPQRNFESLFSDFQHAEKNIMDVVGDTPGMDRESRKASRRYLQQFFDLLESHEKSQRDITGACHPWPPSPEDHTTPPDSP